MSIILGESPIQRDPERMTCAPNYGSDDYRIDYEIDGNPCEVVYELADGDPIITNIIFGGVAGPLEFDPATFRESSLAVLREAIRKHEGFYS